MARIESTLVSVDVLTLRFDARARAVLLAVAPRGSDPFAGALALPGVLLGRGERLRDAALRAVTGKLGLDGSAVTATGQLATFDEPSRDPRGPTLSVALWATVDPAAPASGPIWTPPAEVPALAFDHDRIVADCRPMLADRLWRDVPFTAGLLGREFTTAQALDVTESLTGDRPYPANLGRTMDRVPGLERTEQHAAALPKGGRPPLVWRWTSTG
ncbi:NUDIX domain-containing protein [Actinosynnema sp. NPDC047251]|uniref:NUDIX family hydrolase n=1 Tax=Saccharothrix espanaensis (strain ATCC 51144 / DSM 44229 / JCM 9112 / NBRC 15066 / NRRL 15764) TaxID=1179773 RepID=K0K048_SACES|nr:NUDIX domain-containing protein [Saccharothrix espanaensis]CCH31691.1 NUDIX family hydrolase [Saccharothrix espanaensis DSM 44229]